MSRNPFYPLLLLVVLMGVSTVFFNVHKVEAPYPIVYIKAEGSIEDFEYFDSTIRLHVSNSTANQTHGFCRLTTLHDLLPPPYDVTINSIPVNHTLLFENDTLTLIYLNYTHSTVEIVIIPEFPSFLILLLLMVATLLAVIEHRKKHSMHAISIKL